MAADSSLSLALAAYIRALTVAETVCAEDRPVLQSLTASAVGALAEAVLGNMEATASLLEGHERLRGHSWLQGAALEELDQLWASACSHWSQPAI